MATFAPPNSDLPDWLQTDNSGQLQAMLAQLPALFSTKGLTNRTNAAIASQMGQGEALAAAGARSYQNRAAQVGASGLGAGFAQGQALLPYFAQRNSALSDLERTKLTARAQQAQMSGDLAARIAQLQQMRQSQLSDYSTAQQKLQMQGSQFDETQSERSREFNTSAGMQQQSQNLDAMKLALSLPRQRYEWNTNRGGLPDTMHDQQQSNAFDQQQNFFNSVRNRLGNFF